MRTRAALAAVVMLLLVPSAASASLANEQQQGKALVAQIRSGTKACAALTSEDLDHIGEYAMFRAPGSTRLHQVMNDRMTLMLGPSGESRMHQLLGKRYAGCSPSASQTGSGMMGDGPGGWSTMMGSGGWGWMMGDSWRSMSHQDWQRLESHMLGTSTDGGGGWSPLAIVAVTLDCVALVATVILLALRRPFRRPPASATHARG